MLPAECRLYPEEVVEYPDEYARGGRPYTEALREAVNDWVATFPELARGFDYWWSNCPAAKVGGGGGGGGDKGNNAGGGFGISAKPAGAWIIRDGDVTWEPAIDATRIATTGMLVAIIFLLTIRSIAKANARAREKAAAKR